MVEQINNRFYFRVIGQSLNLTDHIITLTSQLYNGQTRATDISSEFTSLNYSPSVIYNASKHQISISITAYSFEFLTHAELKIHRRPGLERHMIRIIYKVLTNNNKYGSVSQTYNSASPYLSYTDLQPIRKTYIHSRFGIFNTLGANGESSIVNIPVSSDFNDMIIDQVLSGNDFRDCSSLQTLRTIKFYLKDSSGNLVPMNESKFCFIIFSHLHVGM